MADLRSEQVTNSARYNPVMNHVGQRTDGRAVEKDPGAAYQMRKLPLGPNEAEPLYPPVAGPEPASPRNGITPWEFLRNKNIKTHIMPLVKANSWFNRNNEPVQKSAAALLSEYAKVSTWHAVPLQPRNGQYYQPATSEKPGSEIVYLQTGEDLMLGWRDRVAANIRKRNAIKATIAGAAIVGAVFAYNHADLSGLPLVGDTASDTNSTITYAGKYACTGSQEITVSAKNAAADYPLLSAMDSNKLSVGFSYANGKDIKAADRNQFTSDVIQTLNDSNQINQIKGTTFTAPTNCALK